MTKTIGELGAKEAEFLSRLAADGQAIFSTAQAQAFWGNVDYTTNVLNRLVHKGWLQRLQRGVYIVIPLEAGPERAWSESALVIAPHLIQPAAVAYWSALHFWNMTEQVPRVVFVQSTRRKRPVEILGMRFRFVSVSEAHFFGIARRILDGKSIYVTDREKTLLDAAARPDLSGGPESAPAALLNWPRRYGRPVLIDSRRSLQAWTGRGLMATWPVGVEAWWSSGWATWLRL